MRNIHILKDQRPSISESSMSDVAYTSGFITKPLIKQNDSANYSPIKEFSPETDQ